MSSLIDLSWNFGNVSDFCAKSETKHEAKGYKYFAEKYITDIQVLLDGKPVVDGSASSVFRITAKCHRSMRKNEAPHDLCCFITSCLTSSSEAHHALCSCAIGSSGCCGHIIGLLFQLADYKTRNLTSVPDPVPCTSLPQQWHKPRGSKIGPTKIDDIHLSAPTAGFPKSRAICSNMYNPVNGIALPKFCDLQLALKNITPNSQWLTMQTEEELSSRSSGDNVNLAMFGQCGKGSVLSYQQMQDPNLNINMPGIDFPSLPVCNVMSCIPFVANECQTVKLNALLVTEHQVVAFERETRNQSDSSLWHSLRQSRITASKVGTICKRRSDFPKLCCELRRNVRATLAMKEGLVREPLAAQVYATVMEDRVNLYPCGLVISPFVPWLAASPDRKVYCPERIPSFGLLEIKCPQADQLSDVTCLTDNGGNLTLKLSHDYYYQMQCQMAVTGLQWCDFVVYLANGDLHVETITFDSEFWHESEEKLHSFYFNFFINEDDV